LKFASRVLPKLISEFLETHLQVRFSVSVRVASTFVNLAPSHNFDLGVSAVKIDHAGITSEPFYDFEIVCALPPGHLLLIHDYLTPELIASTPFIELRSSQVLDRQIAEAFNDARVERNVVKEKSLALVSFMSFLSGRIPNVIDGVFS